MRYSVSPTVGSPAIRHYHPFGIASCAVPFLVVLTLYLCVAGQVRAHCGNLSGPSTTWSDGNGSWGVSGNWTSGTPNASTNACIVDGTSAVTLNTNRSEERRVGKE